MQRRGQVSMVAVIAILLILLFFILAAFRAGLIPGFNNLGLYSNTYENTFEVEQHCRLLCLDGNATKYCLEQKRPLPLALGDAKQVEGSCYALSTIGIRGFAGVPTCRTIQCSGAPDPVCKQGRTVVPCSEFQ